MTNEITQRRIALHLLKRGIATQSEVARLLGRSRQIVRHWALDLPDAREQYLQKQFERAKKRFDRS